MSHGRVIEPLSPQFPPLLARPLRMLPAKGQSSLLVAVLNRLFAEELREGELDFLQGRVLHIILSDLPLQFRLSLHQGRLVAAASAAEADVRLEGSLYHYMLLAARREDADALFFSRRLKMQGDTELGLYIKNFLDGLDLQQRKLPAMLESLLSRLLPVYEKLGR